MGEPRTWRIDHRVREDADQMFVPADRLPDAGDDDVVELVSDEPPLTRRGRIVGRDGDHVIVALDP